MDKEEFRIKLEQINSLVEKKDYKGAMEIVDSIDWRRVKSIRTLCVVGEIYAANKRYEDSKEILLLAYHRAPIGKSILYRLIEVSLRMGDINDAEDFYDEFIETAPNDNTKYILQYKISKAKNVPIEEQIAILEEYKNREYTERWSYELAKLYYKAGDKEKSAEVCDDLILWFSDGKYVMKAMDLKQRMGVLTNAQKDKYEQMITPKLKTVEEIAKEKQEAQEMKAQEAEAAAAQEPEILEPESGEEKEQESEEIAAIPETNTSFQEKIARGIKDIFGGRKKEESQQDELFEEEWQETASEDDVSQQQMNIEDSGLQETKLESVEKLEPEQVQEEELAEDTEVKVQQSGKEDLLKEKVDDNSFEKVLEDVTLGLAEEVQALKTTEEIKMPEFKIPKPMKIPESMKRIQMPEFVMPQVVPAVTEAAPLEKEEDIIQDSILEEVKEDTVEEKKESEISQIQDVPNVAEQPEEAEEVTEEPEEVEEVTEEPEEAQEVTEEPEEAQEVAEEPEEAQEVAEEPELSETQEFNFNLEKIIMDAARNQGIEMEEDSDEDESVNEEIAALKGKLEDEKEEEPAPDQELAERPLTEEELLEKFIDDINEEPERDLQDIIPREMKLTEEEEELFSYFTKVPGMKEQLLDTLLDVQMSAAEKTSKTGNVIVMGNKETGKTRLIQGLVPAICRELHMEAAKIAYVFAEQLNGQNIARVVNKLSGGFLVIEHANQLEPETVEELNKAMEFRTDGLTVIIEDEKIGMRKLIAKYPKFAKKFTSMINIPVFTNDELVNFAKIYTKENGYVIDHMGMLALYNLIGDNQKEDEPMTIGGVKLMVDAAIDRAESGARKLKRNLSKKRTDAEGNIVLYEKDFS